jgi:hypothetical protein
MVRYLLPISCIGAFRRVTSGDLGGSTTGVSDLQIKDDKDSQSYCGMPNIINVEGFNILQKSLPSLKYLPGKSSTLRVPPPVEATLHSPLLLRRAHALQSRQLKVYTPLCHQLIMSPLLYDLALIKHVDDISVLDRR